MSIEKSLNYHYNNPSSPAYLSNATQLYRVVKNKQPSVTRREVGEFLERQKVHQIHRKNRESRKRKKQQNVTIPLGILDIVKKKATSVVYLGLHTDHQCDLGDFTRLAKANRGMRFLLVVCDVLSRQGDAVPIASKSAENVLKGFKALYEKNKLLPMPMRIFSE